MELAERWNVPPWEITRAPAAELYQALEVMQIRDTFAAAKDAPARGKLN